MRKILSLFLATIIVIVVNAQTPINIGSLPNFNYTENFSDISNWAFNSAPSDGTFTAGIGSSAFKGNDISTVGTVPSATKITVSSLLFATPPSGNQGFSSGVYKGNQNLVFLSAGTTDNTTAVTLDLFLNFTGVNAGTLSYDWASINNSTGNRKASFKVFATVDGTSYTDITAAQVLNFTNNSLTSGTVANITLPSIFNNSATARLRFYFYNGTGGTSGSRPRFSIDNIKVTGLSTVACVTPTAQPTALQFNSVLHNSIQLSFTAANPLPQNYIVVMSNNSSLSSNPVNGVTYNIDDNLGDGNVVAITNNTTINITGLSVSTRYYFFIFSMNNACTGGPLYLTTAPLSGNVLTLSGPISCVTPVSQAINLILSNVTLSSISGNYTPVMGADEYLIIRSLSPTFTGTLNNGTNYNGGNLIGNGSVVTRTSGSSFIASNLINGTTYYFFVFAINNLNCNGGPLYNIITPLTNNATTISLPTCITPTAQPTLLNLTATNTNVTGFFKESTTADTYLVLRTISPSLTSNPQNNVNYLIGNTLGNAIVVNNNGALSFIDINLMPSTTYFYFVFAKNSVCNGGTMYFINDPLTSSITTTAMPTTNFYFGNLHAHSSFSDGNQDNLSFTPADNFAYAKNSLCLDFLGISDHNHATAGMNLGNYSLGLNQAIAATTSSFLALYGMEWGVISNGGHVLVYGSNNLLGWETNNYNTFVPKSNYLGKAETTGVNGLFRTLNNIGSNTFALYAHPNFSDYENLSNIPFNSLADSLAVGTAVASGVAFSSNTTYNDPPSSFGHIDYFYKMLSKGYHLGPTMDHDSHNTNFGRSTSNRLAIAMPNLNSANFYTAMKSKRFYATEDCDTKIFFSLNNQPMGTEIVGTNYPSINAYVIDPTNPSGATSIRLMYGMPGSNVFPVQIASSNTNTLSFTDFNLSIGATGYYFIDATIAGNRSMSSPIWFTRQSTVPISIAAFGAQLLTNNQVKITFEIPNETAVKMYFVEKSMDGIHFEIFDSIENINLKYYSLIDFKPTSNINYYRLKMSEYNGKISYSNVVSINLKNSFVKSFSVSPNPLNDWGTLTINSFEKTKASLSIFDLVGRKVEAKTIQLEKGNQSISMSFQHLQKGNYYIHLQYKNVQLVDKFIKLK